MTIQDTAARCAPYVLSMVRIVAALLFFEHGTSRLFGWPSPLPTPAPLSMYWFAGAIELVGGALLALGLFTRPVALIIGVCLFHQPCAGGLFPDSEPRRRRHSLLLHLSLYRVRRRRPLECGCTDGAQG